MGIDEIGKQLERYKGSFVTLAQLTEWIAPPDYPGLCAAVAQLLTLGLLRPAGPARNTNGMVPPLRLKYRILRAAPDYAAARDEIRRLSPALNISGYLEKPELYRQHRDVLLPLSDYLRKHQEDLRRPMAKNERAFSIWKNEKLLDRAHCQSVLRFNGWETRLNFYPTPEPFFDYLTGGPIRTLLILENKDTWYTLRRLLLHFPAPRRLFGARIDGVVLGEGRKATRPHALEEYAALLPGAPPRFLYWGDLDYAGIDIFLAVVAANPILAISLFVPAYQAMLRRGRESGRGRTHTEQPKPAGMTDFLALFTPAESEEIAKLLADGQYLPQEILTCPYLTAQLEETEDHDV